MTTQQATDLSLRVQQWAEESAKGDLLFSGDGPWRKLGLSAEQRATLEKAMILYARTAACRTLAALRLHGHLKGN